MQASDWRDEVSEELPDDSPAALLQTSGERHDIHSVLVRSGEGDGIGHAEPVGVEDSAADLHLGDLMGEIMCGQPLAQALQV